MGVSFFIWSCRINTKKILSIEGQTREEELIEMIFTSNKKLEDTIRISKADIYNVWRLYTEFRNIYAHSNGLITTQKVKSNLGGKIEEAKKALYNFFPEDLIATSISDIDSLFKNHRIEVNKFYFLTDKELNIFRNLSILIMEGIDSIEISNKN